MAQDHAVDHHTHLLDRGDGGVARLINRILRPPFKNRAPSDRNKLLGVSHGQLVKADHGPRRRRMRPLKFSREYS